ERLGAAARYGAASGRHAVPPQPHDPARPHRIRGLAGAGAQASSAAVVARRARRAPAAPPTPSATAARSSATAAASSARAPGCTRRSSRCEASAVTAERIADEGKPEILRGSDRLLFVDNIRWTMIVLVLSMHACVTYIPFGNWYYRDPLHMSFGTTLAFAVYQSVLQAFFMSLLFFIAGYFAASSFERKGSARFVRDRAVRLGLPTLLYMLAIGPVTEYFLAGNWGHGGRCCPRQARIRTGPRLARARRH